MPLDEKRRLATSRRIVVAGSSGPGAGIAAALAVAGVLGVPLDAAAAALAAAEVSPWRMESRRTPGGAVVLNDAYNANPNSMRAALETLAALKPQTRRIAVLLPELVVRHWWENLMHNRRADLLKVILLVRGNKRIVVINLPWYLDRG